MSIQKALAGAFVGLLIMLFGLQMYSVGGYGVMEPIYRGIIYLGLLVIVVAPIYYWVIPTFREPRDNA